LNYIIIFLNIQHEVLNLPNEPKLQFSCLPQAGIHNNPFEEGFVFRPEDYLYSSATDYAGQKGLLDNVIVVK
jgi:hypothetical protein